MSWSWRTVLGPFCQRTLKIPSSTSVGTEAGGRGMSFSRNGRPFSPGGLMTNIFVSRFGLVNENIRQIFFVSRRKGERRPRLRYGFCFAGKMPVLLVEKGGVLPGGPVGVD